AILSFGHPGWRRFRMGYSFLLGFAACSGPLNGPAAEADELTKPLVVWSGRYPAAGPTAAPATWTTDLIGKEEDWVKFWKARRGDEQVRRVDFGRSVVVVATWPGMAADSLHLGPCGKQRHAVWVGAWEGKIDGVGYVMGVFPRSGINDVDGKPLPR